MSDLYTTTKILSKQKTCYKNPEKPCIDQILTIFSGFFKTTAYLEQDSLNFAK